ncbi:unnamed protein product [Ilex paraguariensis]|uniref:TFIIS N-terminal domain-containing protein n=1 Tax=Ilex paraguariensis TaxID=185542 RepID=A0ABC8REM5_9AQUA
MDLDDFRVILSTSNVDVWTLIQTAIAVASLDYGEELKDRRDSIVEKLYASSSQRCSSCHDHRKPNGDGVNTKSPVEKESIPEGKARGSPSTPESNKGTDDDEHYDEEGELDPYGGLFEDELTKILRIKERLEDPLQSEESVVGILQNLVDMEITFQALKETDIGRHVNQFRKHPSDQVRKLVKQLVRNWKELVDEWVRVNQPEQDASTIIADGDSPQQNILPKNTKDGHHQVPDFAYSPNPHTWSSGSDKTNSEPEQRPNAIPKRETPTKRPQSIPVPASVPPPNRAQKETLIDAEKLNSARRRLHENYQEAQNAKKQRTIQVMDIHDIPKPKNTFFAKNKGGFPGRNHR